MFKNLISTGMLDTELSCYRRTVHELEETFDYRSSSGKQELTRTRHFMDLHRITKDFYAHYFGDISANYVPLYHSLWKLRLKDASELENIHQDAGVHYFSANGYQSRMITLWTNIYKDHIPGLSDSDMGIFVVDNTHSMNRPLYDLLEAANSHFFTKRKNQLTANMYVGGEKSIRWDLSKLVRTYFDYRPGTFISFNSHLLHGSTAFWGELGRYSADELGKFRVSLSSVWLHKDDVAWDVVSCPEAQYENLYLSRVDKCMWPDVKEAFDSTCRVESVRLASISALIRAAIKSDV